jgi:hypothetical protein
MNIGSLYTVKKYFWFLFSTKAVAAAASDPPSTAASDAPSAAAAGEAAAYLSRRYDCEVTYFSPDSIVVFLENDGKLKKVLTSDGKIGWTWFSETYNECFEEVNP